MAQKVMVQLVDDLDGSEATQTVQFALDGVSYEIDLNETNAAKIREEFGRWTDAGRRTGGRSRAGAAGRSSGTRTPASGAGAGSGRSRSNEDSSAVRDWAKAQGLEVSERGRIPASVREAYAAAH